MNTGMLYEFLTIICDIIGLPIAVWQSGTEDLPVFIWPAGKAGSYDHPCTDIRLRKQIEKNLAADLPAVWFENEMVYFGIWKGNDRIFVIGPAVRNEVDGGYQTKYENDHAMHRTLPLKRFPFRTMKVGMRITTGRLFHLTTNWAKASKTKNHIKNCLK